MSCPQPLATLRHPKLEWKLGGWALAIGAQVRGPDSTAQGSEMLPYKSMLMARLLLVMDSCEMGLPAPQVASGPVCRSCSGLMSPIFYCG